MSPLKSEFLRDFGLKMNVNHVKTWKKDDQKSCVSVHTMGVFSEVHGVYFDWLRWGFSSFFYGNLYFKHQGQCSYDEKQSAQLRKQLGLWREHAKVCNNNLQFEIGDHRVLTPSMCYKLAASGRVIKKGTVALRKLHDDTYCRGIKAETAWPSLHVLIY